MRPPIKESATTPSSPIPGRPVGRSKDLVRRYLGPQRRAGRGVLSQTASGEDEVYRAAGFTDRRRIEIAGRPVDRTADEVVASIFSLSSSTPHLFGDRRP